MSAHRTFPEPCEVRPADHRAGDRHVDSAGGVLDELTATGTWTRVCPVDDVAMTGRDGTGWMICPVCQRTPKELAGVTG